eukprot:Tbor_TRINITY_DN3472_c0_g1::TRINITY_DN3472_c0_g1_i1::g.3770::m.3770/K15115/SLC25A32, MFT; solute carrier family 25 (mitochondrial folate transporter), member 32
MSSVNGAASVSSLAPTYPQQEVTSSSIPAATPPTPGRKHVPYQHMIATQGAAAFTTFLFFPFDVVKMRFMSQDGTTQRMHNNTYYRHTFASISDIYVAEGLRSLYYGVHVAVCGSVLAWGSFMFVYKTLLVHYKFLDSDFFNTVIVASMATTFSSLLSNPIFLIKTRMQIEDRSLMGCKAAGVAFEDGCRKSATMQVEGVYKTFHSSLRHIVGTTGVRSLWRGMGAQLLLGIPNSFHLPIYEYFKRQILKSTKKRELDMNEVFICTASTKTALLVISHPICVLKTRIQDRRSRVGDVNYVGVWDSVGTIMKREGVRGFFRGIGPALLVAVPRAICHFSTYEGFLRLLAYQ